MADTNQQQAFIALYILYFILVCLIGYPIAALQKIYGGAISGLVFTICYLSWVLIAWFKLSRPHVSPEISPEISNDKVPMIIMLFFWWVVAIAVSSPFWLFLLLYGIFFTDFSPWNEL
jgi:hypothetical protein